MDGFLTARLISDLLFGFPALISIINPFGGALIFAGMTRGATPSQRVGLAWLVARNSFFVLLTSLILGARVLSFFGISLEALRIAGGLVVAFSGWQMLSSTGDQRGAPESAGMAGFAQLRAMAFFPLTLPLTTGPGSIAAAIALGAQRSTEGRHALTIALLSSFLIAASVAAMIWLAYRYAGFIERRLGPEGSVIAGKISAFLLLCVGAQIVLTGATDALRPLLGPGR